MRKREYVFLDQDKKYNASSREKFLYKSEGLLTLGLLSLYKSTAWTPCMCVYHYISPIWLGAT
jgi:hypothetical protein